MSDKVSNELRRIKELEERIEILRWSLLISLIAVILLSVYVVLQLAQQLPIFDFGFYGLIFISLIILLVIAACCIVSDR